MIKLIALKEMEVTFQLGYFPATEPYICIYLHTYMLCTQTTLLIFIKENNYNCILIALNSKFSSLAKTLQILDVQ